MPLERQEVQGFLGVNLRRDRATIADQELARAINGDLHRQVGAVVLRLPRSRAFPDALTDLVVRRLATVNQTRYQIAGQSAYRDQVKILDGVLSTNLVTTITPFRPLTDTTLWAFIADDAVMRKDSGRGSSPVTRIWGIVAPTVALEVTVGGPGSLSGVYTAGYTWVRFDGVTVAHESNPSPTASVTLASQVLGVGEILGSADPQVNGFGVYRTVAGGTTLLLDTRVATPSESQYGVAQPFEVGYAASGLQHIFTVLSAETAGLRGTQPWEVDDDEDTSEDAAGYRATSLWERTAYVTTQTRRWSYVSTIADSALGAAAALDNDPPPLASWAAEFQGHMFLCRDAAHPDYLWFSKRFRPEAVPVDNFIIIGTPADPIQCAVPLAGLLAVLTKQTKYRVLGSTASGFVAQEALSARGTTSPLACLGTEFGLIFPHHDGVFRTNVIAGDEELTEAIAPMFFNETVNDFEPINWDAAGTMAATYYKGRYYLSLPTGTHTTPNLLAVYSITTKHWYFFDHPARSLYMENVTDRVLAGFTDGYVYVLEDAASEFGDAGAASSISADWQTKDYFGGSLTTRKLFQWVKVDVDCRGDTVTAELFIDGTRRRTVALSGTRRKILLALPGGAIGYTWRVRLTYAGIKPVRWYGAEALWMPMAAA